MDHPGAGGAVVVAVEAAGARPLWTRVSVRVTRARAGAAPPAGAAAGALVAPVPAAAARAPPPAWTRLSARQALAVALSLLGCVAAVLAFFAMILPLAGTKAYVPTDSDVASLRTASQYLLLAAAAQMLAAAMGLLVPVAIFGTALMGVLLTAFHTSSVLEILAATTSCHGSAVHGAVSLR